MRRLLVIPIFLIQLAPCIRVAAQSNSTITLDSCIAYAIAHNTGVIKQELANSNYRQDNIRAVAALLPSISGDANAYTNYGRSIDPETNTYTNTENFSNRYSISANLAVFSGFTSINTVRTTRLMKMVGMERLQQIKDELALRTMQAFMDVVYLESSVAIAKEQLAASTLNLEKSQAMLKLGLKSAADVAQVEAQVASDDLLLTQQQNRLNLAMLSLKEQMNFPIDGDIHIDTSITSTRIIQPLPNVLDFAMVNNPKIVASNLNLKRSRIDYSIAIGAVAPTIYLGAGYSTGFYKNTNSTATTTPYAQQLNNNRGMYFGASISVPIFNGLHRKTNINRQRNLWRIAEQENEEVKRALQTEITQTMLQVEGYSKELIQATKKVEAASLAHRSSQQKFEKGLVGPIELQISANELLQAKSQQLNAKLQLFIKKRMMEYYGGRKFY